MVQTGLGVSGVTRAADRGAQGAGTTEVRKSDTDAGAPVVEPFGTQDERPADGCDPLVHTDEAEVAIVGEGGQVGLGRAPGKPVAVVLDVELDGSSGFWEAEADEDPGSPSVLDGVRDRFLRDAEECRSRDVGDRVRARVVLVEVEGDRHAPVPLLDPIRVGGECGGEPETAERGRAKALGDGTELSSDPARLLTEHVVLGSR
jgi:hypothetical protein